jgi:type II secretory pathway component PulF
MIEPVLIIFLGGAVGGIALAIITPIYALTSQFGQ